MKIHNVEQGSAEWHALRCITATETKCLMVKPKNGDTWGAGALTFISERAVKIATGYEKPHFESEATAFGKMYEPMASKKYEEVHGFKVDSVGFVEHDTLIGCSPDGFVGDAGLIEIKCPFNQDVFKGYIEKQEAPKNYLIQMMHQLWTTNRDWVAFFAYDPRTDEYFHKCYDMADIEGLLGFPLDDYVQRIYQAREYIQISAEVLKRYVAKNSEKPHVCRCKSQEVTVSEHREIWD